jgi:hypothetical protein
MKRALESGQTLQSPLSTPTFEGTEKQMRQKNTTHAPEEGERPNETPLRPIYRVGDTIIFKYEGNLRAKVEGYEIRDSKPWLVARAFLNFKVPFSLVVGVEPEE